MGPQEQERRLTTILSADVVGYSRLMGHDEAGTLDAIKAHRRELIDPKAAQYNGRTIKLMGDGALMEFASVVDAVHFAVEVQCAVQARNAGIPEGRRILYRIGINIGDIIVDGDDIYGGGVNVAARLEGLAEPGGICLSRAARDEVRDKLALDLKDLGEVDVKNIVRPVRVFRVVLNEKAERLVTEVRPMRARRARAPMIVGASIAAAVVAGGVLWWKPWVPTVAPASVERMAFTLPEKPSIAVLPFDNLSGEAEEDYFADGVTEDIITDLSKFHGLFVIARNSTFTYKDKPVKVQEVAEELGVRYVVEGSCRRANGRLRVTAQLIDALTGRHVWAESYDRDAAATLKVQDEIVDAIVTALAIKVDEAERQRVAGTDTTSHKAYDLFLRARDLQLRKGFWIRDVNQEVRRLLEEATSLDPQFSRAYADLAWTHLYDFIFNWTDPPEPSRARALELARKAVSLDPSSARAHYALGYVFLYAKEHDLAAAEVEKAIALNPNDARFRAGLAGLYTYRGEPQKAVEQITKAMRLNPFHPDWYWHFLGWARFHAGQYEEALEALKRIVDPGAADHRMLAATYSRMGRLEDAVAHASKVLELEPDFSVSRIRQTAPYKNTDDLEDYLEALRLAGLPD
jgi:adenylate cyclase